MADVKAQKAELLKRARYLGKHKTVKKPDGGENDGPLMDDLADFLLMHKDRQLFGYYMRNVEKMLMAVNIQTKKVAKASANGVKLQGKNQKGEMIEISSEDATLARKQALSYLHVTKHMYSVATKRPEAQIQNLNGKFTVYESYTDEGASQSTFSDFLDAVLAEGGDLAAEYKGLTGEIRAGRGHRATFVALINEYASRGAESLSPESREDKAIHDILRGQGMKINSYYGNDADMRKKADKSRNLAMAGLFFVGDGSASALRILTDAAGADIKSYTITEGENGFWYNRRIAPSLIKAVAGKISDEEVEALSPKAIDDMAADYGTAEGVRNATRKEKKDAEALKRRAAASAKKGRK